MLIRTEESDFSTSYNRLGQFAKLATSSIAWPRRMSERHRRMLSRHLHPVAIVENVAIEAQCLFDLGIPGIALLGSAPPLLAAPPLGFRIGEHVTHRLCQGLDHCLRTIERNGTADTVVHHLCRPSIGNGAHCPRRGHRLKQDSASRFTHRGQAEHGPVTGVLQ
jgi:hypothetical protein